MQSYDAMKYAKRLWFGGKKSTRGMDLDLDLAVTVDARGPRGFLGLGVEETPGFSWRDLYIEVGGVRRLQMRCGFRPRDRDRTTERMEGV